MGGCAAGREAAPAPTSLKSVGMYAFGMGCASGMHTCLCKENKHQRWEAFAGGQGQGVRGVPHMMLASGVGHPHGHQPNKTGAD